MQQKIITSTLIFIILNLPVISHLIGVLPRSALMGILFYICSRKLVLTKVDIITPVMLTLILGMNILPKSQDLITQTLIFVISSFILRQVFTKYN